MWPATWSGFTLGLVNILTTLSRHLHLCIY
jgi:hypothetical protein